MCSLLEDRSYEGMRVVTSCAYGTMSMTVPSNRAEYAVGYAAMFAALARSERDIASMICDHIGSLATEIDARGAEDAHCFTGQEDAIRSMIGLFTLTLLSCRPQLAGRIDAALKLEGSIVLVTLTGTEMMVTVSSQDGVYSQRCEISDLTIIPPTLN